MGKIICFIICSFTNHYLFAQAIGQEQIYFLYKDSLAKKTAFDSLKYTKVIAYNFALNSLTNEKKYQDHPQSILNSNNTLHLTTIKKGIILKQKQIDNLLKLVADTATYGAYRADCFIPRLAFVFYNKNKIVGVIDICFECNFLVGKPKIYRTGYHTPFFKDEEGKYYPAPPLNGFSIEGRKKLKQLCRELNMPYCIEEENTDFDKKNEE